MKYIKFIKNPINNNIRHIEFINHHAVQRFVLYVSELLQAIFIGCNIFYLASHYAAILLPHAPGAVHDLARNAHLGNIISYFWEEKSKC